MYKVLYRKWRPQSFDDVVGQEYVTQTLRNELEFGRIGHAYLFIGSRGTGKTTCAKIFAKAINCDNAKFGSPCGYCEICKGIDNGTVMDVVEMDAASNNGVNDIRTICEEAAFTPSIAKYRVYIIDEVHMLSPGAFNALLKTLEEPPEHVVFILATTEAHKIPATILSRCQRFEFHRIPVENICSRLKFIADKENIFLSDDSAKLIARISDGALRDALSILDKCINLSSNVTVEIVNKTVGIVGSTYLFKISDAIINKDPASALKIVEELFLSSKDMMRLCEELVGHFRNVMITLNMRDSKSMLMVSDEEFNEIIRFASLMSIGSIVNIIDVLEGSIEKMLHGCNRRIELETSLVKLCRSEISVTSNEILERLSQLEAKMSSENLPSVAKHYKKNDVFVPDDLKQKTISQNVSVPSIEKLSENATPLLKWPEVLQKLKEYSHTIAMAFNGSMAYISGDYILIDAPKEVAFELLRKSSQRDKMRVAIKDVTGRSYKLGPYKKKCESKDVDPLEDLAKIAAEAGVKVTID